MPHLSYYRRIWHLAYCRLPGFTGPFPPPLLIRFFKFPFYYISFLPAVNIFFVKKVNLKIFNLLLTKLFLLYMLYIYSKRS